jgi:ornithine cyclodeaminase/alanine dehydrogenase-like protein (mu-crystallin family)
MLLLTNHEIEQVLTIPVCLDAIEAVYQEIAIGDSVDFGRVDIYTPSDAEQAPFHRWSVMTGNSRRKGYVCARMLSDMVHWPMVGGVRRETKWAREPGTYCGLLFLYSTHNGEPLAILPDGVAQHLRVGAAAGLGAKALAREDSRTVGMLGSGGMARSYLEAFCHVRPIERVRVFSPTAANRDRYAAEMAERLGVEVTPVASAREAVRGADIAALCVSAVEPVFEAHWLEPGMHVADLTAPSTRPEFAGQVDIALWHGYPTPILDALPPTAMYARGGFLSWAAGSDEEKAVIPRVPPNPARLGLPTLGDLFSGRVAGRTSPDQTTFFHNVGAFGSQFVAVAAAAYERALEAGLGRQIPTEWFLEDVRD